MLRPFSPVLLATVSLSVLTVATPAWAAVQDQPANTVPQDDENIVTDTLPESDADATLPADEAGSEAIVVTGTRIRTPQYDFANPVVSVDSSALQNAGTTNLTNFLSDIPSLVGSFDANSGSGSNAGIGFVGLNLLNLRNLGTQRTLVLVDGRRHVSAVPGSSSVDVNTIPIDLIDRVDVLTGGASAIYGADAVTGVVNFVTKRDFEGVNIRAQAGISEKGDTANQFVSFVAGKNFSGGRGNIAIALEYGHDDPLHPSQRKYLRNSPGFAENPDDFNADGSADDPNVPDFVPVNDIRYFDSAANSGIDVDLDLYPDFLGNGRVFNPGTYIGSIFCTGCSGTPVSTYQGEILPRSDRYVANLLLNYDVTDKVNVFAQAKYARVDSASFGQPTYDFTILVTPENPFLPANVRDAIENNFGIGIVNRDNLDIGGRGERNRRETIRGVIGATAELTDRINFDVSYVYGQSDSTVRQTNTRFNDRFLAAIDVITDPATGQPTCRSNLQPIGNSDQPYYNFFTGFSFGDFDQLSFTPGPNSGCIPFNLFSEQQAPGAIEWLVTDAVDKSRITQHVATASLSGDLGENIALWGGPIGFAVGAEYRKERSESNPDPINTTGLTFGNALFPETGQYSVKEAFGEVRVPIAADRPFFHDLSVNGAIRISDYSTVGTTTTWQVSGVYAPVRDVRFRGTYSQAVRAPNIGELFGPQNQTFEFIDDPCATDRLDDGSEFRAANCQALLTGLGLTPAQIANFDGDTGVSIAGTSGGNPNLREETAKTITGGVVLRPRFLPGFSASVDYYDVKIENAVSQAAAEEIANLCVDQPTLDNVFCEAITRNPGNNAGFPGAINGFRVQPENVAQFRTSGWDLAANYRTSLGRFGTLNLRAVGNILEKLEFIATPGGAVENSRNRAGAPRHQVNTDVTWAYDKFQLNWGMNYFSKTRVLSYALEESEPDYYPEEFLRYSARFTHDFQLNVNVSNRMSFYGGVNNAFNQKPDFPQFFYPVGAQGRYMYAGARMNF
ncbi:MAG TPA: TonB-dependent receptor [Allosphingosinicella sp.]|jgi:outer membrane receptor protein involved in Fe transport